MTRFTKPAATARTTVALIGAAAVLGFSGQIARADSHRDHPRYENAISDLRLARTYLAVGDDQYNSINQRSALAEINKAIQAIRSSNAEFGRDRDDTSGVDRNTTRRERIRRALDLLDDAQKEVRSGSDFGGGRWKRDALDDINDARDYARKAALEDNGDDHPHDRRSHPHFMHALSDLRAARALLRTADRPSWQGAQRDAVEQIDDAIHAAQDAARADNLDLSANPPVDDNRGRQDRLGTALDLLKDAHAEMTNYPEGSRDSARALRDAVAATDAAARIVMKLQDDHRHDRR